MSKRKYRYSGPLVYSTHGSENCIDCGHILENCRCGQKNESVPKGDGIVRVSRETKGRKGKGVSIISGLGLSNNDLNDLSSKLKSQCGSGGTVKDHRIEIQGDHRDKLVLLLEKLGYTAKKVGG